MAITATAPATEPVPTATATKAHIHPQGSSVVTRPVTLARTNGDRFDFLARHRGMFSLIGAAPEQVARLRDEHAVYMIGSGRINVAGLPEAEVDRFADALVAVLGR